MIGAGVAGLAAAQTLSAAGVSVHILEARNRIGGRIDTVVDPASCLPIELGAEFIHGRPKETFEMVRAAGLTLAEVTGEHSLIEDSKLIQRHDLWTRIDQIFARMSDPSLPDQTFSEFLEKTKIDPEAAPWAKSYVEGFNAAHADRISTHALVEEEQASQTMEGDRAFRIREGYQRLVQWLWQEASSRGARLQLGAAVQTLRWQKGRVEVRLRGEIHPSFTAERAIITVPLGVLKATGDVALRFEPELLQIQASLDRLEMGAATRVTLVLDASFRQDHPNLSGFIHSSAPSFPTWWTSLPSSSPVLTGWCGGPKAEKLAGLSEAALAELAVNSLAQIFRVDSKSLARHVKQKYVHNWSADPFALGAYSYARVGGIEARHILATPIVDTLYFAGEATHTEGRSATVDGAIATGRRAARAILGSLRVTPSGDGSSR